MVSQSHQWDWQQILTNFKYMKLQHIQGRDTNMVLHAMRSVVPYHEEMSRKLLETQTKTQDTQDGDSLHETLIEQSDTDNLALSTAKCQQLQGKGHTLGYFAHAGIFWILGGHFYPASCRSVTAS
ncbi:hypothetical protein Y1Q_0010271 [Alligator mississippiensis]|uniref:Uncharacterized protein n=1 Tax=Alligator mississippiensis TaxID=8496 RepID=A0A151P1J8_ALLMI|nr:hypothetical protein Y1Q_0010271 [Alligator mississippiensis]